MSNPDSDNDDSPSGGAARDPNALVLGGDSKHYTVAALRKRVQLVEPGIVVMRELPVGARETLVVMTDAALELAKPFREWALVVDLVDSQGSLPSAYRSFVPGHLNRIAPTHIAIALYMNPVVRAASRFMARRIGLNVTIHKDRDTAVAAVRQALPRYPTSKPDRPDLDR
jgi:hypothetical protein